MNFVLVYVSYKIMWVDICTLVMIISQVGSRYTLTITYYYYLTLVCASFIIAQKCTFDMVT